MATPSNDPIEEMQKPLEQAAAHPWFEPLARFGYAAKGMVYFVIGLLAAQAAFGVGGKTTDSQGVMVEIIQQPFGKFLLAIMTIGIIGYVCARFVQATLDPENAGKKITTKRVLERVGYAFSALAYAGLALSAVKLILGTTSGDQGDSTQDWTARLMAQPFGRVLVGLVGIMVIGVGIGYLSKAIKGKFRREFKLNEMSSTEQRWAVRIGRVGIAARASVFALIGAFLILAAVHSDPSEAKGSAEALAALEQSPFGAWLLGIVAIGLIAYSIYSLIEARYRQIVS